MLWELEVTDPVTAEHIDRARERLVRARPTHLDSLLARLQEDRVRRVLEPILAGTLFTAPSFDNDFDYVCDLGLVAPELPPRIANPVYREIILRVLAVGAEASMPAVERPPHHAVSHPVSPPSSEISQGPSTLSSGSASSSAPSRSTHSHMSQSSQAGSNSSSAVVKA